TGKCPEFDYSNSARFQRQFPGGVLTYLRGITLGSDGWSEDDFTMPPVTNEVVATERATVVLKDAQLSHLAFTPIEEYEIPERFLNKERTVQNVNSEPN